MIRAIRSKRKAIGAVAALLLLAATSALTQEPVRPPAGTPPEEVERRLAQIAVTVTGQPDKVRGLTAAAFELIIGGREIGDVTVDDLCRAPAPSAESPAAEPVPSPASFVFYFDQPQMSPAGRRGAIALARDLVPQLVVSGNRAMIVSSADRMKTFATWSSDPAVLLEALAALEADPTQTSVDVVQEAQRTEELIMALKGASAQTGMMAKTTDRMTGAPNLPLSSGQEFSTAKRDLSGRVTRDQAASATLDKMTSISNDQRASNQAVSDQIAQTGREAVFARARGYQLEERDRARRSVERLGAIVTRMTEVAAPKAVLYFADALRQNPGEHYYRVAGGDPTVTGRTRVSGSGTDDFAARNVLDPVVEKAASGGVRFYAVQAEGLLALDARSDTGRVRDAQGALTALANETGGRSFLNGVSAGKIGVAIEDDLGCGYLLSFDPRALPQDAPLPVTVKVSVPGAKVRHPGLFVVEGASRRRTDRLVAAALEGGRDDARSSLVAGLVPLDFDGKRYRALAQVGAPPVPNGDWDLGFTVTTDGRLGEQASRRVAVPGAAAAAIFEAEIGLMPGAVELTALALDRREDQVDSLRTVTAWPDPDDRVLALAPVALMQPDDGAFVRGETVRTRGSRVLAENEPAAVDRPLAFIGLLCRSADGPRTVSVERRLAGTTTVSFAPFEADLSASRCAQIRDVVPAETLGAGGFVYTVLVLEDGTATAAVERSFQAAVRSAAPPAAP